MADYNYPNAHRYCYECVANKYSQCLGSCDDMKERGYRLREGLRDCFVEEYCFECKSFMPYAEYDNAMGECEVFMKTVWAHGECERKVLEQC